MKLGKLKAMIESASDNAEISIENGEITIIEPEPIQYKFNIGDKVTFKDGKEPYTVTDRFVAGKDCPAYKLDDCENVEEDKIELYVSKDITDRIKTFDDAYDWCEDNGYDKLTHEYEGVVTMNQDMSDDVVAYMKLRIITAALNEGWEPTHETSYTRYVPYYNRGRQGGLELSSGYCGDSSGKLCFRTEELAIYAAKQFRGIYTDFAT